MAVTIELNTLNVSRISVLSNTSPRATGGGVPAKKKKAKAGGGEGDLLEDAADVCSLSYKQRIIGFGLCLIGGFIVAGLGYMQLIMVRLRMFVVFFSIGNIIMLASTMFLMGPISQLKRMFIPSRIIATCIFLVAIAMALFFGYVKKNAPLAIVFGVIEFFALIWYSLTYIPFANALLLKCLGF